MIRDLGQNESRQTAGRFLYNKCMNAISSFFRQIKLILTGERKPHADNPRDFAFEDWKMALVAAKDAVGDKRLGLLAAGIAYFATFAFFPLVAVGVAVSSFIISEESLSTVVTSLEIYLPSDIASLVTTQLENALKSQSASTLIAIFGILLALFSVSGATQNLISAGNVAYERKESRGLVELRLTSLGLLLSGLVGGTFIIGLLLLDQSLLVSFGMTESIAWAVSLLRWIVIAGLIGVMLAIFYRYGPDRPHAKWQWVTWGSVIASVIWLIGTVLFFIYARFFANFSESYSLFAGIIVLMTWFNLTAFIVLLGAEINYRLEQQTVRKTTK